MTVKRIHSVCTRDNIFFDFLRGVLDMKDENIFHMIHKDISALSEILYKKGIDYDNLKAVLTPPTDKKKKCIILCFEAEAFGSCYGLRIYDLFFPLLDKSIPHIIKAGDISLDDKYINKLVSLYEQINFIGEKRIDLEHNYFLLYINNVSPHELTNFIDSLKEHEGFVGYIDGTIKSVFCDYIANSLIQLCLQYKTRVILPHTLGEYEDDENVNERGIDFKKYGFDFISVDEYYYDVYLTYQITTNYVDEGDIRNSLLALSKAATVLGDYEIIITEDKYQYCIHHNEAKMKASLIGDLPYNEFVSLIKSDLKITNIYSLEYKEQYNVGTFSTIFEHSNPDTKTIYRFLVTFAYNSEEKTLKLITMY